MASGAAITTTEDVVAIEKAVLDSIRNAKGITKLLQCLAAGVSGGRKHSKKDGPSMASIHALRRIFSDYLKRGLLALPPATTSGKGQSGAEKSGDADGEPASAGKSPQEVLSKWLHAKRDAFLGLLAQGIRHRDPIWRVASLRTYLVFVALSPARKFSVASDGSCPMRFDYNLLHRLVEAIVTVDPPVTEDVIDCLVTEYSDEYDDFRYYLLKAIRMVAESHDTYSSVPPKQLSSNLFGLLEPVSVPPSQDDMEGQYFAPLKKGRSRAAKRSKSGSAGASESDTSAKCAQIHWQQRVFQDAWLALLRLPLTQSVYRKVLSSAAADIIPNAPRPLLFADFFIDSFSVGGIVSLLALDGLWHLMQKHGLDYPDFYHHVYALITPVTMHAPYAGRFLRRLALFLTSSQLAAYVAASFAKRMARVALVSPPHVAQFTVAFLYNLLKRHPAVSRLIHRGGKETKRFKVPFRKRDSLEHDADRGHSDDGKRGGGDSDSDSGSDVGDDSDSGSDDGTRAARSGRRAGKGARGEAVSGKGAGKGPGNGAGAGMGAETVDRDGATTGEYGEEAGGASAANPKEGSGAILPTVVDSGEDVFDAETNDLRKTRALESSLWEVAALQAHFHAPVMSLAKVFSSNWAKASLPTDDLTKNSYESMFAREAGRKTEVPPPVSHFRAPTFVTKTKAVKLRAITDTPRRSVDDAETRTGGLRGEVDDEDDDEDDAEDVPGADAGDLQLPRHEPGLFSGSLFDFSH